MQRVFNSFCLHGTWQPNRHNSYIDREPRMTVTAFSDMCEYCMTPNFPKISPVGAQGMFNVVKTRVRRLLQPPHAVSHHCIASPTLPPPPERE